MNLAQQKTAAKVVGGALVVGMVGWGLSAAFSGSSKSETSQPAVATAPAATPAPVRPTVVAQPQPQQQPAPVDAAPKKGDNSEQKAIKLSDMLALDKPLLAQNGFTISTRLDVGYCTSNGGVDGSGWHGVSSGISYGVTKNGQTAQACVSHKGGKPQSFTTNFTQAAAVTQQPAVLPQPAPVQAQPRVTTTQNGTVVAGILTASELAAKVSTNPEKITKLTDMLAEDRNVLGGRGVTLNKRVDVGNCVDNGTVDGSGWHGVSSGISYEASKGGQSLYVCVSHKGGKPVGKVTGSVR